MIDIGSWLRADPGPDYGAKDIVSQQYTSNAFVDGGQFAYEYAGVRKMAFPLIVPSGGVGGNSLDTIEAMLRQIVRPGAYVDIQPDGVPTAEMVRFDILGGRVNHDPYSVYLQRVGRRYLSLELDTQPYGYWPTWINLRNTNTFLTTPAWIPVNHASIIGDAPALAQLFLLPQPTMPGTAFASGPDPGVASGGGWTTDFVAWGIGGGSAFGTYGVGAYPGAMWGGITFSNPSPAIGTYRADAFVGYIGSGMPSIRSTTNEVVDVYMPPGTSLSPYGVASPIIARSLSDPIGAAPYPQLRVNLGQGIALGRYRAFMYAKLGPSGAMPVTATLDVGDVNSAEPLASANVIATILPGVGSVASQFSTLPAWGQNQPSSAFVLYDMGEISIPRNPAASAVGSSLPGNLRLWLKPASTVPTVTFSLGAVYLLPLDGGYGIMARGMTVPTIGGLGAHPSMLFPLGLEVDGQVRSAFQVIPVAAQPQKSALAYYRGGFPQLGATISWITVISETRRANSVGTNADGPLIRARNEQMTVGINYRPQFQFLKGL